MLKRIGQIHRWLGVLFAPLIIFFASTGVLMTFHWHESTKNSTYTPPVWLTKLSEIHKNQRLSRTKKDNGSTLPLKFFVATMGSGLVITTLLGIWMAFRYQRNAWLIVGLLLAGLLFPAILLFI